MNINRKIADNVLSFLDKAAALHAKSEAEQFSQNMYGDMRELGMQSPIEDMFWVALNAICAAHCFPINPDPVQCENGVWRDSYGIHVSPQARIGKYRVDFLVKQALITRKDEPAVVVELDGHDFHDKDKRQRAYEKARDRFLVSQGCRVLHFTGSEVVADPFKVAYESLALMGVFRGMEYDADHPLGVEL